MNGGHSRAYSEPGELQRCSCGHRTATREEMLAHIRGADLEAARPAPGPATEFRLPPAAAAKLTGMTVRERLAEILAARDSESGAVEVAHVA